MQYTLDTDFGSLNGPKAKNWLLALEGSMLEEAFAGRDNQTRLLGNLLVLEPYAHTLRQGLEAETLHPLAEQGLDLLWEVLVGRAVPADFQELANNLYACVLEHNVGEDLTQEQERFQQEYFRDDPDTFSWQLLEWVSVLLLGLVAVSGGRVDFNEFKSYDRVDFYGLSELVNMLQDVCVELTGTPMPSSRARDVEAAFEQVSQTPLFRGVIAQIQTGLKAALSAEPGQYAALREEYRQETILPARYAAELLEY